MLKSLYSGVTGMKSQQTKMDVISNNIANVNTTGFKTSRVRFEDMISQINASAQGGTANGGGINPQQVGMGVQVGSTDTIMTAGSLQTTGRDLDFGIQNGDNSFFVVSSSGDQADVQFTRDGGFYTDGDNQLVTASGMRIMGYAANPAIEYGSFEGLPTGSVTPLTIEQTVNGADLQSYSVDNTGLIVGSYSDGNSYVIGQIALANFANPDGLEKAGGNMYVQTANSGEYQLGTAGDDGYGVIRSGFLEMSNVDLATEFTEMIVTSRAYQANSRSITTSDEMLQELLNLKR
ncbi:flagellar hook-basal body complex protein [Atopococcus tabaci]|uniref:flagellar hook-basal body complex protein n=1 Tax=Atopococcus tabaci TaxID=269774 RepID=UPI0003F57F05|nr:flagellar hook-basal body complex protein [Atopococcus tabaci]